MHMGKGFFKLPFRPEALLRGMAHETEPQLETAIGEHVTMILRTARGESPGNPEYGCRMWDHLAERVRGESWLAQFKDDILEALLSNEPRLSDVVVEIKPTRAGTNDLALSITASTVPSGRPFRFSTVILTDPIRMN